jgi:streptogramin lyase
MVPAALNHPRSSHGATVDAWGRIWVAGGGDMVTGAIVEIYDPLRPDSGWTELEALLEVPRGSAAPGVVADGRGRLYVIGGAIGESGEHVRRVDRFDPCHPKLGWERLADIPGPNSNQDTAAVGADGRIYVAGGWLGASTTDRVVRYDPDTDVWEAWCNLQQRRSRHAMVRAHNGAILVIGGERAPFVYLSSIEALTPPCGADLAVPSLRDCDGDGDIDFEDVLCLLITWGSCEAD